ncbi:transthyretin-like family domain-containing protein [Ditylenchus destructor]|uniref:Transthyretin-like family domain-containing protein n=1 Tax=Ditylenchus destructor TaxID=166010 RepID=A0AAD4MNH9_9BILA|nr:transthyretin-like family domain-containing protein [Ditylenchus destructor]
MLQNNQSFINLPCLISVDPDDLLQEGMTNAGGYFDLQGGEDEVGSLDVYLLIEHGCPNNLNSNENCRYQSRVDLPRCGDSVCVYSDYIIYLGGVSMYFFWHTLFCCLIGGVLLVDPEPNLRCDQSNVKEHLTGCKIMFQSAVDGNSTSDEKLFCEAMYNFTQCSYDTVKDHCDNDFVPVYMRSLFKPSVIQSLEWEVNRCEAINISETSYEEHCNSMYRHHRCIFNEVGKRCGFASAKQFMTEDPLYFDYFLVINSSFCSHCSEDIKFLDRFGRRIRYGSDNGSECSPDDIVDPVCVDSNATVLQKRICETQLLIDAPYEQYCDSLNATIQCEFDSVTENCGSGTAKYYLNSLNYSVPNSSYCPYCSETVRYLESIGTHLYDLSEENGTCPNPQASTTPTPTTIKTTSTSSVATTTEDPMVACLRKLKDEVSECENLLIADGSGCSIAYKKAKCVFDKVRNRCDENQARVYMKTELKLKVPPELCEQCYSAIDYLESVGGHLYHEDDKGNMPSNYCMNDCSTHTLKDQVNKKCNATSMREVNWFEASEELCNNTLKAAQCANKTVYERCGGDQAKSYMQYNYQPKFYACSKCRQLVTYMDQFGGKVQQVDRNGNILSDIMCPLIENMECVIKNAQPLMKRCEKIVHDQWGPHYCSELDNSMICTYNEVDAVCGEKIAKEHMKKNATPTAMASQCPYCSRVAKYMEKLGGHLYYADEEHRLQHVFCTAEIIEHYWKNVNGVSGIFISNHVFYGSLILFSVCFIH